MAKAYALTLTHDDIVTIRSIRASWARFLADVTCVVREGTIELSESKAWDLAMKVYTDTKNGARALPVPAVLAEKITHFVYSLV